jgi:PAS domain S-box-containing protein
MEQHIKALSSSQRSLAEMLTDCSIDRVMAVDLNWEIIAWNKASEKASGIHRKEIIGKKPVEGISTTSGRRRNDAGYAGSFFGEDWFCTLSRVVVQQEIL